MVIMLGIITSACKVRLNWMRGTTPINWAGCQADDH